MSNEKKKMLRTIRVDEDALEVMFLYDDQWKIWIGQYPFFKGGTEIYAVRQALEECDLYRMSPSRRRR